MSQSKELSSHAVGGCCRFVHGKDRTYHSAETRTIVCLTEREQEVAMLLCDGKTTEAMAKGLFVAMPTLRNHIQSIMAKLEVHSRLEAAALIRDEQEERRDDVVKITERDGVDPFENLSRRAAIAELRRVSAEHQVCLDREKVKVELAERAARARVEVETRRAEQAEIEVLTAQAELAEIELAEMDLANIAR